LVGKPFYYYPIIKIRVVGIGISKAFLGKLIGWKNSTKGPVEAKGFFLGSW